MPFQSTIEFFSGSGIPGELYTSAPVIAEAFTIVTTDHPEYNVFGRAFSQTDQNIASAGQPVGSVYKGIMFGPKNNISLGIVGAPLSPTLTIPNETIAEIASEGTLFVELPDTASIGDVVIFDIATGELATQAPGTALPSGFANANATVVRFDVLEEGLAVIQLLAENSNIHTVPEVLIGQGLFTWSGSGATVTHTITGALVGDTVFATIDSAPTQAAYLVSAKITGSNTLTVTLSAANTSNDAVIAYRVTRA